MTGGRGHSKQESKLSALLDRVENGEEIIITRHGKPVVAGQRLVPRRLLRMIDVRPKLDLDLSLNAKERNRDKRPTNRSRDLIASMSLSINGP